MPVTSEEFRQALSTFASGVTVVTTKNAQGELFGLTVSAFSSVSLEPPLILVCIEKTTRCHDAFVETGRIAVNILGEEQSEVSQHFATQNEDKFEDADYRLTETGLPSLSGALAVLECEVLETYDGGDHTIFVARVDNAPANGGAPLLYFRGRYRKISDQAGK